MKLIFFQCFYGCCLYAAATLCLAEEVASEKAIPLVHFLPAGRAEIEFMKFDMHPRAEELTLKLMGGLAKNREWFAEFMETHVKPGMPIPYHANLGVSETEYTELLDKQLQTHVAPRGITKEINITRLGDEVTFQPLGWSMPELASLTINVDAEILTAGEENFGKAEWDVKRKGGGAFGPWRGYQWAIKPDITMEAAKTFLLGGRQDRLEEASLDLLSPFGTDYVYFYLRRRVYEDGEQKRIDVLFRYAAKRLPKDPLATTGSNESQPATTE